MKTIAIVNQKGGVGKTTVAFNLAKGMARRGDKVLVIDNDPQGNLTTALVADREIIDANILNIYQDDQSPEPFPVAKNLFLIGSDIHLSKVAENDFEIIFKLREGLERYKQRYDYVIIDCLPSFGYLSMAALTAGDHVLVPTKPAPFALSGLKDLFDTIEKVRKRLNPELNILGIVLNLLEARTVIGTELCQVVRENYGDAVFKTTIHKSIKVEESPSFHKSIMEYDSKSKTAKQFKALLKEIKARLAANDQ